MWNITNYAHISICQCEEIDPDKSKYMTILFQYVLRGYSNIDMLGSNLTGRISVNLML